MGNLVADAQRVVTRADVAIMNNGGIRAGLPAGVVTYEQLFQLQPFANRIVVLTLTGKQLLATLEFTVENSRPSAHISGITVRYDSTRAAGQRIREVRLVRGNAKLDPNKKYRVAVNDFMATGGSGFVMLRGAPVEETGKTDLEVLEAYLARLPQPSEPPETGRFKNR